MRLQDFRIATRLALVVLIAIIGMITIGVIAGYELRATLLADRKVKTQHVVEVAYGVVNHFAEEAKAGTLNRGAGEGAGDGNVEQLRYDEKRTASGINDMTPKMLMHRSTRSWSRRTASPTSRIRTASSSRRDGQCGEGPRGRLCRLYVAAAGCWITRSRKSPM